MTTTYQYIISGIPTGATSIQVCINGGVIATTDSSCYNGVPVPYVRVKWNSLSSGSVTVSVNGTNASLTATVCDVLKTGKIDSASRMQIIRTGTNPSFIYCGLSTGGNCSPVYNYQWQQSSNGISWNDIAGATTKDLQFSTVLTSSAYYRRKTTETTGNSLVYSDIAIVSVVP